MKDVNEEVQERLKRYDIERVEQWREKWVFSMPWISFPADWQIQVTAPFGGAIARFRVKLPDGREKSVYFDAFNALGYCYGDDGPKPYWEVYPVDGDTGRCDQYDTAELLRLIAAG